MPEIEVIAAAVPPVPKKRRAGGRDGICVRRGKFEISWMDANRRRRTRITAACTLAQARALREAELLKVEKARTLGLTEPSTDSFQQFSTRFLAYQKARLSPKGFERDRGIVQIHLLPAFGARRLADIRRGDIEKYITARSLEVSSGSVIKEANVLKHIFNLAAGWELIPFSPAGKGLKLPKQPAGRLRYLQPPEFAAVWQESPLWLRPIVALAVFTGMRRGEILGLRWLDVDFAGGRLLLPQTKTNKARIVWLNAHALRAIKVLPRTDARPTDKVFPRETYFSPEAVSLAFLRACRRCGVEDFCLHDLRHTAASWMRMSGADIHTVAQLLGHSVKQAERYQHLSPTFLAEAARGLDKALGPALDELPEWREEALTAGQA